MAVLFARQRPEEQAAAFASTPCGKRKVILATNVAETSLTIPDVVYIVDTMLKKQNVEDELGVEQLTLAPISKYEAKQRKGRAGRVAAGHCYRLCSEDEFNSYEDLPTAEFLSGSPSSIADGILRVMSKQYEVTELPVPPSEDMVEKAKCILNNLELLTEERVSTTQRLQVWRSDHSPSP